MALSGSASGPFSDSCCGYYDANRGKFGIGGSRARHGGLEERRLTIGWSDRGAASSVGQGGDR